MKHINSKLINIFKDPEIDEKALNDANSHSQERIASLFKITTKNSSSTKKKDINKDENKPKEKLESMMKRILDKGIDVNGSTPTDSIFRGDSMKIYNFFLNKLL